MQKRRYSITASEDEVVPVLASFSKSHGIPNKSYLAMLACDSCNTTIVGSNLVTPFCPCCSHEMHATSEDLLPQSKQTIEEMNELATCDKCDTTVAMPKDIEASLHDHALYCPSCSSAISLKAADKTDETDEDEEEDNLDDTVSEDDPNLFNNEDNEGGESDSSDSEESSDETNTDDTETADSSDSDSSDSSDTEDSSTDATENTDNSDEASNDSEGENVPEASLNANLISYLSNKGGGATSIVASPGRDKWFLFVDNYPVAVADKNDASDNVQGMFNTDKFSTAWEAATGEGITEDVLNDFGFKATTVSVPVDEAVRQNVEASIEEATRKFNTTAAMTRSRFERCFGIAAVGINKNVFKETNPIKTAITASLKRVNFRNPEALVASAFAAHGEAYLSGIALKASELMDKSDETLDELAKTVDESKYNDTPEENSVIPNITPFPVANKQIIEDKPAPVAPVKLAASDDNEVDSRYSNMFASTARRHNG